MKKYLVIVFGKDFDEAVFEGTELECMEYCESLYCDFDIIPSDCY